MRVVVERVEIPPPWVLQSLVLPDASVAAARRQETCPLLTGRVMVGVALPLQPTGVAQGPDKEEAVCPSYDTTPNRRVLGPSR